MSAVSGFNVWSLTDLAAANEASPGNFDIFLDCPSMRAEVFALKTGSTDTQSPHEWDELYYIQSGQSTFVCEGHVRPASAGDIIFVPAGAEHRFYDIKEDMTILVVFAKQGGLPDAGGFRP